MNDDFYERKPDGTSYKTAEDERNEKEAAKDLAEYFSQRGDGECEFHPFAKYDPLDWWVERNKHMVGVAELKCRSHASTTHGTVWLAVRKWLAMRLAECGFGVKAIFAVRFTDGLFYIPLYDVDASKHIWGGCGKNRAVNSQNTTEPMIEVPVADMRLVKKNENQA